MTVNELTLFVENIRWVLKYDDSNPDVGWGMSPESALEQVCRMTNIPLDYQETDVVIRSYNTRYGQRR